VRGGQRRQTKDGDEGVKNPRAVATGGGRSEAEDTLTIISHGDEISIAGGEADEKDDRK